MSKLNELTNRERKAIRFGLDDVKEDRATDEAGMRTNWPDEADRLRRFSPGTHGASEALHLAQVQYEVWTSYVKCHPSVVMCPDAYRMATLAAALMQETYQVLAAQEEPKPQPIENEVPAKNPELRSVGEEFNTLLRTPIWAGPWLHAVGDDEVDTIYVYTTRKLDLTQKQRIRDAFYEILDQRGLSDKYLLEITHTGRVRAARAQ